jgi:hypothetical protein
MIDQYFLGLWMRNVKASQRVSRNPGSVHTARRIKALIASCCPGSGVVSSRLRKYLAMHSPSCSHIRPSGQVGGGVKSGNFVMVALLVSILMINLESAS